MAVSKEHMEFLEDIFSVAGPVNIKKMFGGAGVYQSGVMFALSAFDTIYMKVDDGNRAPYDERGMGPFVYEAKGKKSVMKSFLQLPEEALEDPDIMRELCKEAVSAALRCKK